MATTTATTQETAKAAPGAGSTAGRQVAAFAELLLLSVWIGSMIFFSFAVAPSAFAVLPSRELAGKLVTSAISKVELLGMVTGPLLIVLQLATWRNAGAVTKAARLVALVVMIAMAALSRFWLSAKMVSLRQAMGGVIDDVPASDPLRVQFNDLHHYSVTLMGTALLAGLLVLFLTARYYVRPRA